jgi:hypothetical protein
MTIRDITYGDILDAIDHETLDEACSVIQSAAGIKTGDVAGVFFSGNQFDHWEHMPKPQKLNHLIDYINAELKYENDDLC